MYELKYGARQSFIRVKVELLGFKQCTLDQAIFYLHKVDKLKGIICCHVDVFLHSGGLYFKILIRKLRQRFIQARFRRNVSSTCMYIGFKVKQNENV